MKTNLLTTSLVLILMTSFLMSCKDDVNDPYLKVDPNEIIQVKNEGGTITLSIDTNVDDWSWEIDEGDWIETEVISSGLSLEAEPNPEGERRAMLRIVSEKYPIVNKMLSVIQGATFLEITPEALEIPGENTVLNITVNTSVEDWTFSLGGESWLDVEKTETGLKITVSGNKTPKVRTAELSITSAMFPNIERILSITQNPNIFLEIVQESVGFPSYGGESLLDIDTNLDAWDFNISEGWVSAEKTQSGILLKAGSNPGDSELSALLTVFSTEFPDDIWKQIEVNQFTSIILQEDFNWLEYGNAVFYTTTGEKRWDTWTQDEKDRGWVSQVNPVDGSGNTPLLYSRVGFIKLGKTAYGGDLVSPPFEKIVGTENVKVTFKAIPYMTKAGTKDDNDLHVNVIGPGEISQSEFIIDNWPVYPANDATHLDYCINLWNEPEATRTFTITGATSETQIRFLGGAWDLVGVGAGKTRIFLDDIKVEIIQ